MRNKSLFILIFALTATTAMASVPKLGRDLANRLRPVNLTPMPIAADRSAELLAVADSLASVADKPANNMLYVPLIFTSYNMDNCDMQLPPLQPYTTLDQPTLNYDHRWLDDLQWNINFQNYHIQQMYVNHPNVVKYNLANMPEPPKQYEAVLDVKRNILTIEERKVEVPVAAPTTEVKQRNWIHAFDASLQFSQAYMSENWYQGGNNNLNMISNINYGLKLNQNLHPKLLYELTVQYKLGINSAPDDELRDYSINEDLFQLVTKFGLKATKKFYYSMGLQFKTQLLQSFHSNTWDLGSSFLTPGELNAGIGMTYSTKNKRGNASFDASLSPLSYNMKICRATHKISPTTFGIEEGKHLGHEIGSSGECKFSWAITRNISLNSRLFVFSDYSYIQGDWETTIDLAVNKFISTRIYAHLRYDDSADINKAWRYWQFKEVFSFGLQYKFNY